jgi:nitrite reductase (NADH) small subunit
LTRIKIGTLSELPPGGVIEKHILARRVAVFNYEGRLIGMESDCKHMKASLTTAEIKDGVITCRWHGWRYDLATGECFDLKGARLKQYDVEVDGDDVFIIWR